MARHTYETIETKPGIFTSVLKPLFVSLAVTFLALCILALMITYGPMSEDKANVCILLITICAVILVGLLAAQRYRSRGFLIGSIAGLLYVGVAYIVSSLIFGSFSPQADFWKLPLLGAGFGALGGIIGVNVRRKRH